MIRKYHNHKLQTIPWHREEEPLNHHETPGRQIKQSNQLSLPHQDTHGEYSPSYNPIWQAVKTLTGLRRSAVLSGS